ncbi:hypothetical protein [Hymenobacter perfusus]|uniref:Uncharacterized protein n=1 Tax=Hymenobacter perfusus TaxID=1236770 RepID=A0A3R9PQB1_9BACT|nr:hypothetical protein [Hymenobacter perfusus]RSK43556.1 hypothetical protein EI293_11750 [Hymenobacter perfusus]
MMRKILLLLLFTAFATTANGQTVLQGDSLYRGLQVGKSTFDDIRRVMGSGYKAEEIIGESNALLRDGRCVIIRRVIGQKVYYRKQGVIFYIRSNPKREWLAGIDFSSSATVQSSQGITPGHHTFADVIAHYGPVDFDKKDNEEPRLEESSDDGEQWMTSIVFPNVSFRSVGKRQPGENILLRRIEVIRLASE